MAERSNVLLITVDHWAASRLGCAGDPVIQTPTLDELADNGTRFTNCFSTCPVCVPARRSLMTGTFPRTHGDHVFSNRMRMPEGITTMAQAFRDAGYQAYACGKLHVYPQRDRIGFDDVILSEEGRYDGGNIDDYQLWLGEHGYLGQEYGHGMSNNQYYTRPWHLPEEAHQTNWVTAQMVRQIRRKDPTRPAFFYCSYVHPHPPMVPLQAYWDMYEGLKMPEPPMGDWLDDPASMLKINHHIASPYTPYDIQRAKRAYYALCTQIDHQIRLLIGTLREEGLLENTIVAFTSDHGDCLFDHNLVAKRMFYRNSTNVPLIITGKPLSEHWHEVDSRVACLEDVMPTLLKAAGVPVPDTVEGQDLYSDHKRDMLFGEMLDDPCATRMATDGHFKLIYYPYGNVSQLFDLDHDPDECHNLAHDAAYAAVQARLTKFMIANFYGESLNWVKAGKLVGRPQDNSRLERPSYGLNNQRGLHWPPPKGSSM